MAGAQPPEPSGGMTCELRFAPDDYNAYFNDDPVAMDSAPYIQEDRMMVPFRLIGEALGASIGWDPSTREVSFDRASDGKFMVLTIGDTGAVVDGKSIAMGVPPQIREGRTMARDGSVTVLYSVSGNVWAFDRQGGLLFRRHMGQSTHNGVAVSPDGAYIAVGTTTGVCLLNRTGTVAWSGLRAGAGTGDGPHGANAVWLAPDLSALFAGYEDGVVEVFRNTSQAAER